MPETSSTDQTMPNTTQKVALITGAAKRIGAELVRSLHHYGYNILIHYGQSTVEAEQLEAELNHLRPHSAYRIQADLNSSSDLQSLAQQTLARWHRLDVLINNASRFYPTPVESVTEEIWDDLFNSNLRAPFFLSQALAPALKKHDGCIVNLVDIYAERPLEGYSIYNLTKAGLAMLTKTLAKELGPQIRVNGVAPGAVLWPTDAAKLEDSAKQKILQRTALKTAGKPEDICNAVLFLIEKSTYITGQIIKVDGGRSLNQ
jgi:pteridine reductase